MNRSYLSIFSLILLAAGATFAQGKPHLKGHGQNIQNTSLESLGNTNQITLQAPAVNKNPRIKESRFSAEWKLRLGGNQFNDEQSQHKFVDLRFDLRSKYILAPTLTLDLQPSIRLVSGQSQSIDGADNMENKIILNQAALHWSLFNMSTLSAGALNQRYLHSSMLMDDMVFPAARASIEIKNGAFESKIGAETAIPTSSSLSTNTRELEPTPSLNTAFLSMKWSQNNFFWKNNIGYYLFNNLPSSVAQQSMLLGNSVKSISDAQYSFNYQHQGIEAFTELQIPVFQSFDLLASADYLSNDKVNSQEGQATRYLGGGTVHFLGGIDWTLKGGVFSVAPEAAVAYFNSHSFETNRQGFTIESTLAFKPEAFKIGVQYSEAEVIFKNPIQTREKSVIIKLETFYANL